VLHRGSMPRGTDRETPRPPPLPPRPQQPLRAVRAQACPTHAVFTRWWRKVLMTVGHPAALETMASLIRIIDVMTRVVLTDLLLTELRMHQASVHSTRSATFPLTPFPSSPSTVTSTRSLRSGEQVQRAKDASQYKCMVLVQLHWGTHSPDSSSNASRSFLVHCYYALC
jgi:hypothetical protein